MNIVRKEIRKRWTSLVNQQDHLSCKGCPKRRTYDPTKNAEGARRISGKEVLGKNWSRLVICSGGTSEFLQDIV
ncbi:hypothetical protein [Lysinibacillus sp. UGB7]|uniref:hypothetical protein n=1 Tax=Lysinibacillus sp. UGB7 TaxID=3411039 RepID=UPI003B9E8740